MDNVKVRCVIAFYSVAESCVNVDDVIPVSAERAADLIESGLCVADEAE